MDPQLKQRLVGAAVLLALAVIFLPLILSGPPPGETQVVRKEIPPAPEQQFASRVMPLTPPKLNPPVTTVVAVDDEARIVEPPPIARAEPEPDEAEPATDASIRAGLRAWAVQVASFSSEESALGVSQDLRKLGYSAFTQDQVNSKGQKIWFVRVGPELERDAADKLKARLRGVRNYKDAYVVRYP